MPNRSIDRSDFLEYFKSPKTLAQTIIFFSKSPRLGSVLGLSWTPTCCERTEWSSEVFTGYLGCPYLLPYFWLLTGREYIAPQIQKGMEWCAWWRWLHHSGCSRLFSKAYSWHPNSVGFPIFPLNYKLCHGSHSVFGLFNKEALPSFKKIGSIDFRLSLQISCSFSCNEWVWGSGKDWGEAEQKSPPL